MSVNKTTIFEFLVSQKKPILQNCPSWKSLKLEYQMIVFKKSNIKEGVILLTGFTLFSLLNDSESIKPF